MKLSTSSLTAAIVFSLAVLGGCFSPGCRRAATDTGRFTVPDQFLVDKETELVAVVSVKKAQNRWVILPDGDHFPLVVAECAMEKVLAGKSGWAVGTLRAVIQYEENELLSSRVAPPVIDGRRYVLWTMATPADGEVPAVAPWTAHPQGFLQIRGQGSGEFVYWNQKSYSVKSIAEAVAGGRRLPLDQIVDPLQRIQVAEDRLRRRDIGDAQAFVRGLVVNITDSLGQSKEVQQVPRGPSTHDSFGLNSSGGQPHAIWYNSLALLRDFGKDEARKQSVVTALTPIAQRARPPVRLATALALVDLGSDAGRAALVEGLENDTGPISADPPDGMTFPGRYPYDGASTTACAHALARLGDYRGLHHASAEVRLAAAEALKGPAAPEIRKAVEVVAKELQPQVDRLRATGELAKIRRPGDYTNRYPADWLRAQRLLARMGDPAAFRRLVEAYITDAATYPKEERRLVPAGRPVSWSQGPTPAGAIAGVDEDPAVVLDRLQEAYGRDARWGGPALASLRASLERPSTEPQEASAEPGPTEADVAKLLADPDPNRRAEGLAAAGYHQMPKFHDKVVQVATSGGGVERQAAVYALGFYGQEVPETLLRQLIVSADFDVRSQAIELATREGGERFALETMAFVREQVAQSAKAKPDDFDASRDLERLPRLVCRLARGPLPKPLLDGLKDPDPVVRRTAVQALDLSGNPDAVAVLGRLAMDPDSAVREATKAALVFLGPAE
jgi:HEAT repeat protein